MDTGKNNASVSIKYPKPKILLIDIEENADLVLKKEGYNVCKGSFGNPYKVSKSDDLTPVIRNGNLPLNLTEYEIVVINLVPAFILNQAGMDKETSFGENDWWIKCSKGYVDPRSRLMSSVRNDLDKIIKHGGIFIIFADYPYNQHIIQGYYYNYAGSLLFKKKGEFDINTWSFLSTLSYLNIGANHGEEILIAESPLAEVLSEHIQGTKFRCSLAPYSVSNIEWMPLCLNKFGEPVAGIFQERFLIFPQIKGKPEFLVKLLKENLPDLYPSLFPFSTKALWTQKSEYEHPKVLELKTKIEEANKELKERVAALEHKIEEERASMNYLHDLITGTDRTLVKAVKKTLEILGFKKVIDIDEQIEKGEEKGPKREDLQIIDDSPTLLVEVKGISGLPKDAEALQGSKYVAPRMAEWGRTDVKSISIINHQRNLPPLERDNTTPFREDILTNAISYNFGLLTTWDLFRLTRSYLINRWKHEHIKPLFYKAGRIEPVPEHYEFIGEIEKFWGKVNAVGVRIEASNVKPGDRIAFELPVIFAEQKIESLEIDNQGVDIAETGALAGIITTLTKEQARKRTRVFKVKDRS